MVGCECAKHCVKFWIVTHLAWCVLMPNFICVVVRESHAILSASVFNDVGNASHATANAYDFHKVSNKSASYWAVLASAQRDEFSSCIYMHQKERTDPIAVKSANSVALSRFPLSLTPHFGKTTLLAWRSKRSAFRYRACICEVKYFFTSCSAL